MPSNAAPFLRTIRVFGLSSPRGPALTSFLDKFKLSGHIQEIVPSYAARSLDITLFDSASAEEFMERRGHRSLSAFQFQFGEESKLPVELLAGLVLRNASRALKLSPLMDYMTSEWLMGVLSKFGVVEKLEVNEVEREAVVHYMSTFQAIHAARSIIKARLIDPRVTVFHAEDRCDLYRHSSKSTVRDELLVAIHMSKHVDLKYVLSAFKSKTPEAKPFTGRALIASDYRHIGNSRILYLFFRGRTHLEDFMINHELDPTHPAAPFLKREVVSDIKIPRHIGKATGYNATRSLNLRNINPSIDNDTLIDDFSVYTRFKPVFSRSIDRREANMRFTSIVDSSTVIDSVWKGKISSARYKGLQVTYTKDTSHPSSHASIIHSVDPALYTPIHELFRPVVVG